jgi:transposase
MKGKRRKFTSAFKAKVAIEALRERETLSELSQRHKIHANMISKWKQEFLERSSEIFETTAPDNKHEKEIEQLYSEIGKLTMERNWLKKISSKAGL